MLQVQSAPFRHHSIQMLYIIYRASYKSIIVRKSEYSPKLEETSKEKTRWNIAFQRVWRRWRDLNPRALLHAYRISSADPSATWVHLQIENIRFLWMNNMISSQARYEHFDTAAYLRSTVIMPYFYRPCKS